MAKVRIRTSKGVQEYELKDNWTVEDLKLLMSTGVIEEVVEEKPKKKRKKMSDKHRTTEYYKNVDNTEENGKA